MTLRATAASSECCAIRSWHSGDDLIGILHQLELLVAVVAVQAYAGADNFEHVDDAERPVAFVRA